MDLYDTMLMQLLCEGKLEKGIRSEDIDIIRIMSNRCFVALWEIKCIIERKDNVLDCFEKIEEILDVIEGLV